MTEHRGRSALPDVVGQRHCSVVWVVSKLCETYMKGSMLIKRLENWDYAYSGEGKHRHSHELSSCPGRLFALHAEQSVALVLLAGLPLQSVDPEELVPI